MLSFSNPQVIAFCLYSAPLYYMAEKLLGVHNKPMHLRILARLPVCKWLACLLCLLLLPTALDLVMCACRCQVGV